MPAFLDNLFSVKEQYVIAGNTNKGKKQQKLHWQYIVLQKGKRKGKITSLEFRAWEVDCENKGPLILDAVGKEERRGATCFGVSSRPR